MSERNENDDRVWRALAHPDRRTILDRLREKPHATGEMASFFPDVSRFAIMQHLRLLTGANLVTKKKSGRRTILYLNPLPIQQIHRRWVSRYQEVLADGLIDLKEKLENGIQP